MSNINLYPGGSENSQIGSRKRSSLLDGSFFFSIGMFLLVLLVFGGVKLASSNFQEKKELLGQELENAQASFAGSDIDRIMDFQTRIDKAIEKISTKPDPRYVFAAVEEVVAKGVVTTSISYATSSGVVGVTMDFLANDYWSVAKQILSVKDSDKFSNVSVSGLSRQEKGISFSIKAGLR